MPSVFNLAFDLQLPRYTGVALSEFWFNFILMNLIFMFVYIYRNKKYPAIITWITILIFCLFAFWDTDYFSFARTFYNGLENFRDPIYKYFSYVSFDSYIIFRLYIWGIALFLVYKTSKRFDLNTNIMCFVFTLFFMLTFSYARASLGMAFFFYGLSYLIIPKEDKIRRFIVIAVCFFLAYCSHRSLAILIALSPLSLIKLSKKNFLMLLFCYPIIIIIIKVIFAEIASGYLGEENEFAKAAHGYSTNSVELEFNWKWRIITTLRYYSFYLANILLVWFLVIKNKINIPLEINRLLTFTTLIVLISLAILSIPSGINLGLWVIGYRYLYMTGIPFCILLAFSKQNKILPQKLYRLILIIAVLYGELFMLGKILVLQFALK